MKLTLKTSFLTGFFIALVIWWFTIQFSGITDTPFNLAFAFAYGLIPIIGGVFGLMESQKWGLLASKMGKALFFISLGLVTWGMGEMIWSYYNFILQVEVPYPSLADASFIVSWPLWTIGVLFMSFATGAKFGLRNVGGKVLLGLIPLAAIFLSYYLLIAVARQGSFEIAGGPVKIFFDLAYPIWDVVILTTALLVYGLSLDFLGGKFKWPVIVTLLGFGVNYFADFGFSYTTTVETFYNGSWVDLLFMSAMFILSFGVNSFALKEA